MVTVQHKPGDRSLRGIHSIRPPLPGANNIAVGRMAQTGYINDWLFGVTDLNGVPTTGGDVADDMIRGDKDSTTGISKSVSSYNVANVHLRLLRHVPAHLGAD